ncbi:hypothetical protein DFH07DRAFT_1059848 [Mycena maculata]|uniref:Uncharacterized protein n=1 Tax=Mycena maculata TaxID=230809 RepID=A0AAD7NGR0_9AGAR|nr:hypothetical protein DFH07DRAFT_1059848 [Mycena maculata]
MSTSTMTQVPPVVLILGELFIAFSASSLIVLVILRLTAAHFPLLVAVQITFVCTLVVFAALRACGLWNFVYPASEPDFHQPDEKRTFNAIVMRAFDHDRGMPKTKTSARTKAETQTLLIPTDETMSVLVFRPKTHFPLMRVREMILSTDELAMCNEKMTDIAPESFVVAGLVSSVFVAERHICVKKADPVMIDGQFTLEFTAETGEMLSAHMKTNTPMGRAFSTFATRLETELENLRFFYDDISVALTLTPEWEFLRDISRRSSQITAVWWRPVYPLDHPHPSRWKELNTGLDVAYLYWEAHDLCPSDSVLLAVCDITPYLDKILASLALKSYARRPALRAVGRVRNLDITPAPDVVTRVFMLFKRIGDDVLHDWDAAWAAENDTERWCTVAGTDTERASDATLFRVLEWGGMEVLVR